MVLKNHFSQGQVVSLYLGLFICSFIFFQCSHSSQSDNTKKKETNTKLKTPFEDFINEYPDNNIPSISKGTVSNGELINGKLFPFEGSNFTYFDKASYLNGKAFTHQKVKQATLATYKTLETVYRNRNF